MGTVFSQAFSNSSPKLHESERKRDIRIDLLKTIGIFCIIFAHTSSDTDLLYQVRNFDVSLMVISSGILFSYSTQNKPFSFWKYLKLRIPRLIAPVWAFIIFYFASAYPISWFLQQPYPFTMEDFWQGLFLVGGSSYFWIIRVFILVAMLSPFLVKLQKRLKRNDNFFLALIFIYIFYEAIHSLIMIFDVNLLFMSAIFHDYISYVIPYGFLFGLGMVLAQANYRFSTRILGIFLLIFLAFSIYSFYDLGYLISTQRFKYPPELYYLSYGIFMSIALLFLAGYIIHLVSNFSKPKNILTRIIIFISTSSLWIYLWHIFFLRYWKFLPFSALNSTQFLIPFIGISLVSSLVTYLQKQGVTQIVQHTKFGQANSDLLTTLFLK